MRDLCRARAVPFLEQRRHARMAVADVADLPTSALVLAVFQAEGWRPAGPPAGS